MVISPETSWLETYFRTSDRVNPKSWGDSNLPHGKVMNNSTYSTTAVPSMLLRSHILSDILPQMSAQYHNFPCSLLIRRLRQVVIIVVLLYCSDGIVWVIIGDEQPQWYVCGPIHPIFTPKCSKVSCLRSWFRPLSCQLFQAISLVIKGWYDIIEMLQ